MTACQRGNTQLIEPIYTAMTRTPAKIPEHVLLLACFKRKNFVPPSMTAELVRENEAKAWAGTGFDTDNPAFAACHSNPSAP